MNYANKSFPAGNQYWRVDWIGKVKPNPNIDSEPRINVHLTRLKDDYQDSMSNDSLVRDEQTTITVGIGTLPLIPIGSVWRNQQCHEIPSPRKNTVSFQINTEELKTTNFDGYFEEKHSGINKYIPASYFPVAKHFPHIKEAPVFVAPGSGRYKFYLIPQIEIFRFYYICSSFAAKCVWNDDISRGINQEKCDLLIDNDLRIYLKKNLADHESWLLGRWFLSAHMRSQISKMARKRQVDSVNTPGRNAIGIHPHIGFPFEGGTTLSAIGKPIRITKWTDDKDVENTEWAFLVTRIQTCSHPLPFRNLIVDRENSSLKGQNHDDDLELAWTADIIPKVEPVNGQEGTQDLTNTDEPFQKLRRSILELFQQRFLDLSGKHIIKEPKDIQKYKNAGVIQSGEAIADAFNTADGIDTETGVGPISIALNPPTNSKLPTDLDTFVNTLHYLRSTEEIVEVRTLEIGGSSSTICGEKIFHFPYRMKGKRSWHVISETPPRTRGAVVACVELRAITVYLIEIERKSDKHSTQILYTDGFGEINGAVLHQFLLQTAARNRWPEKRTFNGLNWIGVNHHVGDTIERYGNRILRKILNLT